MNRFLLYSLLLGWAIPAAAQPTYSREVSRIFQQKCQICHRPNDIAPFSLLTYQDAQSRGRTIRANVANGAMPPWKPQAGHGSFKNDLSLSDVEKQTILDWVDGDMPEGDPADLPTPLILSSEWRLGAPDQIIGMPVAYIPTAREDRPDRYRCFILPNVTDHDRWVRAVDIVPGLRQVVHHVILYMTDDATEIQLAQKYEEEDQEPGYDCWGGPRITPGAGPGLFKAAGGMLGAWVPGANPAELPSDIGTLVPKGAYIIMQVHYNLENGPAAAPDQTWVGLYFHEQAPKSRLFSLPILNDQFVLAPGQTDQRVTQSMTLSLDSYGLALPDALVPQFSAIRIGPHMHQLGHQIQVDLTQPDGTEVPLVGIEKWDFHWQGFYDYQKPVPLPYRSKIKLSCTFDNTTDRTIRWGESTEDEMCLAYIGFTAQGGISWLLGNPQ